MQISRVLERLRSEVVNLRALVLGGPPLDDGGGVASVCRAEVAALEHAGFTTRYVSTHSLIEGKLGQRTLKSGRWSGAVEALRGSRLKGFDYDLVVSNGTVGWGLECSRSVHFYHGTYAGQAKAIRPFIKARGYMKLRYFDSGLLEKQAGTGKQCLANSHQTAAEVSNFFGHKCAVVWCSVDVKKFVPGPPNARLLADLRAKNVKPLCLFVGAGRPTKGEHLIYSMIPQLRDFEWIVIGNPASVPRDLGEQVVVHSGVSPELMPALLRSVDLVVAPSLYESFGLLVAEALACGTPVVTSKNGLSDLLLADSEFKRFVLEEQPDAQTVADRIRHALDDREEARRIALKGRAAIERLLSPDVWAKRFLEEVNVT